MRPLPPRIAGSRQQQPPQPAQRAVDAQGPRSGRAPGRGSAPTPTGRSGGALLEGRRTGVPLGLDTSQPPGTPRGPDVPTPPAPGGTGAANHGQTAPSGSVSSGVRGNEPAAARGRGSAGPSSQSVSVRLFPAGAGYVFEAFAGPFLSATRAGSAEDRSSQPPSVSSRCGHLEGGGQTVPPPGQYRRRHLSCR